MSDEVVEEIQDPQGLPAVQDPEALLKAYNKAKADLVALREKENEARAELDKLRSETDPDNWRKRAVQEAVKAQLANGGVKDPARVMKLIDLEGVDFNDKDELDGLEDRLTDAKTEFPEVFDSKRRAGSNSADIHTKKEAKVQENPLKAAVSKALTK